MPLLKKKNEYSYDSIYEYLSQANACQKNAFAAKHKITVDSMNAKDFDPTDLKTFQGDTDEIAYMVNACDPGQWIVDFNSKSNAINVTEITCADGKVPICPSKK